LGLAGAEMRERVAVQEQKRRSFACALADDGDSGSEVWTWTGENSGALMRFLTLSWLP
jgi:hypothetical protein